MVYKYPYVIVGKDHRGGVHMAHFLLDYELNANWAKEYSPNSDFIPTTLKNIYKKLPMNVYINHLQSFYLARLEGERITKITKAELEAEESLPF